MQSYVTFCLFPSYLALCGAVTVRLAITAGYYFVIFYVLALLLIL